MKFKQLRNLKIRGVAYIYVLAEIMKDRTLRYIFGLLAILLLVGLIGKLIRLPGGIILPGYFFGGVILIIILIASLIVTGIAKLIFKSNSFLTLFTIVSSIIFLASYFYFYSPTLKIIVPKGYTGQVTLVVSNVDKNILTVDSNGIGYITKRTFDKIYTKPVVSDQQGKEMNDLCVGYNPTIFWANGTSTSSEYPGEIKYLSFEIVPKDKAGQKQYYNIDLNKLVDRTKLITRK